MSKITFKAYNGQLFVIKTWADSPATIAAEKAAFQARLDRGELTHVDILDHEKAETTTMTKTTRQS